MIAQAEGYFKAEGLDVEFVTTMSSDDALVALVTGDIDVRPGPIHPGFLSAIAQGARIKMVAGQGVLAAGACPYYGIVVRQGLDTARAAAFHRIRASTDGMTRYIVDRMLASRGVALEALETVHLPDAVLAHSLENGAVDAVAASEPNLSRIRQLGTLWVSGNDVLPDLQWGVVAFGERLLEDRDTAMRFLRAYRRGVVRFNEGKTPRNVEILAEHTGQTPEVTRAACWPVFHEDLRINWNHIDEFQRWARAQKLMEHVVSRDQVIDSTFMNANTSGGPS